MPCHSLKSFNLMLMGYVANQEPELALEFYQRMELHGELNSRSFIAASMACSNLAMKDEGTKLSCLETGRRIHSRAREAGCDEDEFVATSLVDLYSKCGSLVEARAVFERILKRDVVAWTALIAGHAENDEPNLALEFFHAMKAEACEPNAKTFVAALMACSGLATRNPRTPENTLGEPGAGEVYLEVLEKGMRIHSEAAEKGLDLNIFVASTLVEMYSRCGSMADARRVFDRMELHDVVILTSLLLGYSANGESKLALELFTLGAQTLQPTAPTLAAALIACANLGEIHTGKMIHGEILRAGLESTSLVLVNGLVDLYGKCGSTSSAQRVFDSAPGASLRSNSNVLWNSLLSGYSCSGDLGMVMKLFHKMREEGVQPDGYTFSAVLAACSHGGLIDEGWRCFQVLLASGLAPCNHHFACLVDLFGRAGDVSEALAVIKAIPDDGADLVTRIAMLSSFEVHLR